MKNAGEQKVKGTLKDLIKIGKIDPVRLNKISQKIVELSKKYMELANRYFQLVQAAIMGNKSVAAQILQLAAEMLQMSKEWMKAINEFFDCMNPLTEALGGKSPAEKAEWKTYKEEKTGRNHKMKKDTAEKFDKLKKDLEEDGYEVTVTCTTTGKHKDPAHKEGNAIDFVVSKDGKAITKEQSDEIEKVCNDSGWKTYNEYRKNSKYKTGDHMHVANKK